eukprot:12317203-Alexandrium_andersonii.AAC.1
MFPLAVCMWVRARVGIRAAHLASRQGTASELHPSLWVAQGTLPRCVVSSINSPLLERAHACTHMVLGGASR